MRAQNEVLKAKKDLQWCKDLFEPYGCIVVGWTYRNTCQVKLPSGAFLSIGKKELELIKCVSDSNSRNPIAG